MRIGPVDTEERVVVIGEIGNNHEGDAAVAAELIDAAAQAGADAVKLQALEAERFVRPDQVARLEQLRRFQLTRDEYAGLAEHARSRGLAFVCTPLDLETAAFLEPIVDAPKIASGDNDWPDLLARAADNLWVYRAGKRYRQLLAEAHADAARLNTELTDADRTRIAAEGFGKVEGAAVDDVEEPQRPAAPDYLCSAKTSATCCARAVVLA